MVVDKETNYLYLADCLRKNFPNFSSELERLLAQAGIKYGFLPNTKDIWAVDYMPIQTHKDRFVQFVYNPDYLQSKLWLKTIPDVDVINRKVGVDPIKSTIIVDGGNVVKTTNKVIMTNKVFKENRSIPEKQLIRKLHELFQVDHLIFIPIAPSDTVGHADGMVRFVDDNHVLINDFSREKIDFQLNFRMALQNAKLNWDIIPYNPYNNPKDINANGVYINYLQIGGLIIIPTFNMTEDEKVIRQIESTFSDSRILGINSNVIAELGGVLNCISWNIQV